MKQNRKQQNINKFTLGEKEIEGSRAEFTYDQGNYCIANEQDGERNVIYKSRNAQEAYLKWNILIGRKKERVRREQEEQPKKL